MHGQALSSVYVNGPNAYEIAFFIISLVDIGTLTPLDLLLCH